MVEISHGSKQKQFRCAIYTRKSTEEGLEQEYNTLDAQWDAGDSYIKAQRSRGWITLPTHYDDGGFTGANTERPAFSRLLEDIKSGNIDIVVVYKVDRLSRSLADFANIMSLFDKYGVAFVSVTQYFDTSSSIGRMTLNILITFAQFEREMISERIRDKIDRSRKKGKYMGGQAVLGYDVREKKLIPNDGEKFQIEKIFNLYLNNRSIREVSDMTNEWGWSTKRWKTKRGVTTGGKPISPQVIYTILKNPTYIGKVKHNNKIFPGEHEAIVSEDVFDNVQVLLKKNRNNQDNTSRKSFDSVLKGILICSHCGSRMIKTYTSKPGKKYSYYVCLKVAKQGRKHCSNPSAPANKLEEFVTRHIKGIVQDPELLSGVITEFDTQKELRLNEITIELNTLTVKLASHQLERDRNLLEPGVGYANSQENIEESITRISDRMKNLTKQEASLSEAELNAGEITSALNQFYPVWDKLSTKEQHEILDHTFEQIFWDGKKKTMDFEYSPLGLKLLYDRKVIQDESLS